MPRLALNRISNRNHTNSLLFKKIIEEFQKNIRGLKMATLNCAKLGRAKLGSDCINKCNMLQWYTIPDKSGLVLN